MGLRAIQPERMAQELTPWRCVKVLLFGLSAISAMLAIVVLTVVGGVVYGIASGIARIFSQLVASAVADLRLLWDWVEQ